MKKQDLQFWQKSGRVTLYTATHPEYGLLAGYVKGGMFYGHPRGNGGSFLERGIWASDTIKIPLD